MLNGKTALVTGSTSGIGAQIAEMLAVAGCNVVVNGLGDAGEISAMCERLRSRLDVMVSYDGADLSDADQISAMMRKAIADFGGVDILVNNAGVQHVAAIERFPVEEWTRIIEINLIAAFHTIRHAIPGMKDRGWGRIINVASAHALVASPFKSAYVAAKHGLAGLTKAVALEAAESGITVNAVCPGYVLTPLVERQIPETATARGISEESVIRDVLLAAQPTKRFVAASEVANLCVYLASEHARSLTGAVLPLDGGWTAH